MKKLVFAALAGVFMLSSGFATLDGSKLESPNGTCTYSITTTVTYPNGYSYSYSTQYVREANSLQHCMSIRDNHVATLNFLESIK